LNLFNMTVQVFCCRLKISYFDENVVRMSSALSYICIFGAAIAIGPCFWAFLAIRSYGKTQGIPPAHSWVFIMPALKDSNHPMYTTSIVFVASLATFLLCAVLELQLS